VLVSRREAAVISRPSECAGFPPAGGGAWATLVAGTDRPRRRATAPRRWWQHRNRRV